MKEFNLASHKQIEFNHISLNGIEFNNTKVWGKTYGFSVPTARWIKSVNIYRLESRYRHASVSSSTPILANSGSVDIYYGDKIKGVIEAKVGYNIIDSNTIDIDFVTEDINWLPIVDIKTYKLTLTKSDNIDQIAYKYAEDTEYTFITSSTEVDIEFDSTFNCYAVPKTGYSTTYTQSNPLTQTMTSAGYNFNPVATINKYTVNVTTGNGTSSPFLSTSTTGSPKSDNGSSFNYGTTVYVFATVNTPSYLPLSSWVEVDSTNHIYRVATISNLTENKYITISNATVNAFTYTVQSPLPTGVSSITCKYYSESSKQWLTLSSGSTVPPNTHVYFTVSTSGYYYVNTNTYDSTSNYYTVTSNFTSEVSNISTYYSPPPPPTKYYITINYAGDTEAIAEVSGVDSYYYYGESYYITATAKDSETVQETETKDVNFYVSIDPGHDECDVITESNVKWAISLGMQDDGKDPTYKWLEGTGSKYHIQFTRHDNVWVDLQDYIPTTKEVSVKKTYSYSVSPSYYSGTITGNKTLTFTGKTTTS